ncbi:MAG TPA: TonB-dependent receptor [Thermoanaerobaculia bacterium]|jgi:iron complex outermembrane receptor protein
MHPHFARLACAVAMILIAGVTLAQTPNASTNSATITGRVTAAHGAAVTDATVTLVELRRSVRVGADGAFRFENIPAGHYHVLADSNRFGSTVGEAEVAAGGTRAVEIVLDPAVHSEAIVVTASDQRAASEVYQPIAVVTEQELTERLQPTLGETLNNEPGVNSTYFGPGSSRPIIRGLGSDRIRILQDGVGTGDASSVSPDHAVSLDPASAEQIEVVRGPATLLYGSNAVGGVVNVIDPRVPSRIATSPLNGTIDLRGNSVADERNATLTLFGGQSSFAWHADFTKRDTGDYEIPGAADPFDEPDEITGILANSSLEAQSAGLGGSWVSDHGFFGLAFSTFSTNYGVPGHAHHEEEEEGEHEEEGVRIDLEQRRLDVKGELTDLGVFRAIRFRLGSTDYEHRELEGTEIGTRFTNDALEGRLEATHEPFGPLHGSFGVQLTHNEFVATGEEAFVPPNETESRALFAFEEVTLGEFDLQFGARYESHDLTVDAEDLPNRSFDGVSASIGTIYRLREGFAIAGSVARAVRIPTASELYANGPHAATSQFEIGDPTLDTETSVGIDVSLRKTAGRFRGELSLFQNRFDGYIYETPTGAEEDELPVFQFVQTDARFRGVELDTHTELFHVGERHLELELGADAVRATLSGGGNLPRIPPMRASAGLRYQGGPLSATAEVRRYFEQDDVAEYETTTDGYMLVNATVSYRLIFGETVHDVMLRGTNLTDELARAHTSPLKERAPLPGRDFSLSYRMTF